MHLKSLSASATGLIPHIPLGRFQSYSFSEMHSPAQAYSSVERQLQAGDRQSGHREQGTKDH